MWLVPWLELRAANTLYLPIYENDKGVHDDRIALSRLSPYGNLEGIRTLTLDKMLFGRRTCGACNYGWMSRLEAQAKPILIDLIGRTRAPTLDAHQSLALARWSIKTAYAFAFFGDFHRVLPIRHARALRGHHLSSFQQVCM